TLVLAGVFALTTLAGCRNDTSSPDPGSSSGTSCSGIGIDPQPPKTSPATMPVLGVGLDTVRYTAEIAVRGNLAYTTTWNTRRAQGNKVTIWDVSGGCPQLVDSLIISGVTTTGDVAISDDGKTLVVATEVSNGSIVTYDLTDPRHPQLLTRFITPETSNG